MELYCYILRIAIDSTHKGSIEVYFAHYQHTEGRRLLMQIKYALLIVFPSYLPASNYLFLEEPPTPSYNDLVSICTMNPLTKNPSIHILYLGEK